MGPWGTPEQDTGVGANSQTSSGSGKAWNWVKENGGSVVDTANDVLCLINPKRYGCYPPPGTQSPYQTSQSNALLYLFLAVIIIILFILALRK